MSFPLLTKSYGLSPKEIGSMTLYQFNNYFKAITEIDKMGMGESSKTSDKELLTMAKGLGLKLPQKR